MKVQVLYLRHIKEITRTKDDVGRHGSKYLFVPIAFGWVVRVTTKWKD